jgi:hypothetical protein
MARGDKYNALFVKILSVIVTISLSLNAILLIHRSETFPRKKYILSENAKLREQLTTANNEIKRFKGISEKIDLIVRDAEFRMKEKEKQISELVRSKRLRDTEYESLIDEIDSLKEEYLSSIDSLLVERERNRVLTATLESMGTEMVELRSQLGTASELQSENLHTEGIKIGRNEKEQITALAKKTDLLKVCFDILPSRITPGGKKEIYLVITAPDGTILRDAGLNEMVFDHPEYNKSALVSKQEIVDYQRARLKFCSKIKPTSNLIPGLYLVEVFGKNSKLGMSTFILR